MEARASRGHPSGRPFSPRRAWALILLASGVIPAGVDKVTLAKLRRIQRERSLWSVRARLRSRAERYELRAHSSDLARLEAESDVVGTGLRHAVDAGLDLIASIAPVEVYLDASAAQKLISRYHLRVSDRPNVVFHVVPSEIRGWLAGRVAPPPAIALDLSDDADSRTQSAVREYLSRL